MRELRRDLSVTTCLRFGSLFAEFHAIMPLALPHGLANHIITCAQGFPTPLSIKL